MFGRKPKSSIVAETRVTKTARASHYNVQFSRGKATVQVEQVGDCEPTLWIAKPENSFSTSTMLSFKDLNQMSEFVATVNELIATVRTKQVEMQGETVLPRR